MYEGKVKKIQLTIFAVKNLFSTLISNSHISFNPKIFDIKIRNTKIDFAKRRAIKIKLFTTCWVYEFQISMPLVDLFQQIYFTLFNIRLGLCALIFFTDTYVEEIFFIMYSRNLKSISLLSFSHSLTDYFCKSFLSPFSLLKLSPKKQI